MRKNICLYMPPFQWVSSYYEIIDIAVEHGLQAIEGFSNFEFATPNLDAARKLRAYADEKGIVFSCLSVYADLSAENVADEIKKLKGYAEVAAVLGSPYLHHTIVPDHVTPERIVGNEEYFFQQGIKAVREIFDHAQSLGVRTIYEDQGYIFNGVKSFGRFLKEVDRDVGVVMDLGNIFQVDEKPEDFIEAFHSRFVHVHVKDVAYTAGPVCPEGWLQTKNGNYFNSNMLGDGVIQFERCVSMLKAAGYRGYYAFEFGVDPGGKDVLSQCIDKVESWLQEA